MRSWLGTPAEDRESTVLARLQLRPGTILVGAQAVAPGATDARAGEDTARPAMRDLVEVGRTAGPARADVA
jgi:hypothetical protein